MTQTLFIVFGLFTLSTAIGVVISQHPIYSAFNLVLSFLGLSVLYLLWGSPFAAMLQVLIYTGAIVVLFVFVLMLIQMNRNQLAVSQGWVIPTIAAATVWLFSIFLLRTLNRAVISPHHSNAAVDLRAVCLSLFNEYLWAFEILSVFMLTMVVSIYTLSRPEGGPK